MRSILSERNVVGVLFVMVLVSFALAHEDTKKMEQIYQGMDAHASFSFDPQVKKQAIDYQMPAQSDLLLLSKQ